jgi:hypothetical protein
MVVEASDNTGATEEAGGDAGWTGWRGSGNNVEVV